MCAEAENGRIAVDKVTELKSDVVILDIGMPILNGLDATKEILRDNPQAKVLILTMMDAERVMQAARDAGARGYILKSDASRVLVGAILALEYDNTFFTSRVAERVHGGYLENVHSAQKKRMVVPSLGPREREVLQLVAEGKSSKEVANLLDLSVYTVETHRARVMQKLNLRGIPELILYAVRKGIIA